MTDLLTNCTAPRRDALALALGRSILAPTPELKDAALERLLAAVRGPRRPVREMAWWTSW